jgi:hypothetical protein
MDVHLHQLGAGNRAKCTNNVTIVPKNSQTESFVPINAKHVPENTRGISQPGITRTLPSATRPGFVGISRRDFSAVYFALVSPPELAAIISATLRQPGKQALPTRLPGRIPDVSVSVCSTYSVD